MSLDFHFFKPGQQRAAVEPILSEYGLHVRDALTWNDPFHVGTDHDLNLAEWFRSLYELAGGDSYRGHLRDMHYTVNALRPDLYDGSDASWRKLMAGKRLAVSLGLVRPDALDDRSVARAHDVDRFPLGLTEPMDEIVVPEAGTFTRPRTSLIVPASVSPIDLMMWVEKPSPMIAAEIEPVCDSYGVDVRYASGSPAQSFAGHLAARQAARGREIVLLVLADADFSGAPMPRSLAKQLEVIFRGGLIDNMPRVRVVRADFTMQRVAQIEGRLGRTIPRTVDGTTGEERVELQALPAFVPGELARIVKDAIVSVVGDTFLADVKQWEDALDADLAATDEANDLAQLHADYEEFLDSDEFAPVRERLQEFEQERSELVGALREMVADVEPPEIAEPPTDWLLDTDRSFIEQLQAYRRHDGQPEHTLEPRLCACGCGEPVTGNRSKQYVDPRHSARGRKRRLRQTRRTA